MRLTNSAAIGELVEVRKGQTGSGLLIENDGHILHTSDSIQQMREDIERGCKFVCPDRFIVSAVFQKYGVKNANGRIYPENVLRKEVERYIKENVSQRRALGSLDHPASSTLSGHDISHNILELHWDGCTLMGQMELHLSPGYRQYGVCSTSGDHVANMLLNNYLIGVSSRGLGSVTKGAYDMLIVDDDYSLVCWDVVIDPSTPGSYIGKNEEELQQYVEAKQRVGQNLNERINRIKGILIP